VSGSTGPAAPILVKDQPSSNRSTPSNAGSSASSAASSAISGSTLKRVAFKGLRDGEGLREEDDENSAR